MPGTSKRVTYSCPNFSGELKSTLVGSSLHFLHWKGLLSYFLHWKGALGGTLLRFLHWKGTSLYLHWEGSVEDTSSCFLAHFVTAEGNLQCFIEHRGLFSFFFLFVFFKHGSGQVQQCIHLLPPLWFNMCKLGLSWKCPSAIQYYVPIILEVHKSRQE